MPGSVSESHKIGGPRNSRVRENCCIDSNNRNFVASKATLLPMHASPNKTPALTQEWAVWSETT